MCECRYTIACPDAWEPLDASAVFVFFILCAACMPSDHVSVSANRFLDSRGSGLEGLPPQRLHTLALELSPSVIAVLVSCCCARQTSELLPAASASTRQFSLVARRLIPHACPENNRQSNLPLSCRHPVRPETAIRLLTYTCASPRWRLRPSVLHEQRQ